MSQNVGSRKRDRTRAAIVAAAGRLGHAGPVDELTADEIASAAGVSRATFFRYFDSKESAVVVAFYEERKELLADVLASIPLGVGPMTAVRRAVAALSADFAEQADLIRLQGRAMASSPPLRARSLEYQASFEQVLADALAPRFRGPGAARSTRQLAATALAIVRVTVEEWVAGGATFDLPKAVAAGIRRLARAYPEG